VADPAVAFLKHCGATQAAHTNGRSLLTHLQRNARIRRLATTHSAAKTFPLPVSIISPSTVRFIADLSCGTRFCA